MAMPVDIIMIRHGESEANVIQRRIKDDPSYVAPEGFYDRHDSEMRLSQLGEQQARIAGQWILNNVDLSQFGHFVTSTHVRAMETADLLGICEPDRWVEDKRWVERDWGEYGVLNEVEREEKYGISKKLRESNKYYWRPPGGESIMDVQLRYRDILGSMHRVDDELGYIVTTHGDTIAAACGENERLSPAEYVERDADKDYPIKNCQAIQYSRRNPVTGEIVRKLMWRRSICPTDDQYSWNNGGWVELRDEKRSNLRELVERFPRLLTDTDPA